MSVNVPIVIRAAREEALNALLAIACFVGAFSLFEILHYRNRGYFRFLGSPRVPSPETQHLLVIALLVCLYAGLVILLLNYVRTPREFRIDDDGISYFTMMGRGVIPWRDVRGAELYRDVYEFMWRWVKADHQELVLTLRKDGELVARDGPALRTFFGRGYRIRLPLTPVTEDAVEIISYVAARCEVIEHEPGFPESRSDFK